MAALASSALLAPTCSPSWDSGIRLALRRLHRRASATRAAGTPDHLDYMPGSTTGLYRWTSCSPSGGDTPCTGGDLPRKYCHVGDTAPVNSATQAAAWTRAARALGEAEDAYDKANEKYAAKREAEAAVWKEIIKAAPESLRDGFTASQHELAGASRRRLLDAMKKLGTQPTPNARALGEAAAGNDAAEENADKAWNALRDGINSSLGDRFFFAQGEFRLAIEALDQAQVELNAAREALNALPPLPSSPPPAPSSK